MKIRMIFLIVLCCLLAAVPRGFTEEAQTVKKALILQVQPGTIALPAGDAARVPVSAARVRSTELRELNATYNVVAIEKLYRVAPAAEKPASAGKENVLLSVGKRGASEEPTLNVTQVIRKEVRKNLREKGEELVEYPDVYLMEFVLEPSVEMKDVVVAYWVLPVVTYAQEVDPEG